MASSRTMRAVQYHGYGGGAAALKHVEVPIPSPKKDEVLLKVEAAAINPVDWKLQNGMMRPLVPAKFPFIPVGDFAGEIVEVGPGVSSFKVGEKVISATSKSGGGLAEYAVAPVDVTVLRPPQVSAVEGAALPIAAGTAFHALSYIGTKFDGTGKPANVLVTAASGGVGQFAVQLAKLGNHHVTATCGARNIDLVKSLGADEVLDYRTPEGSSLKSPSGRKYDLVVHCTTGISWSTFEPNLSSNGKVTDLIPNPWTFLRFAASKITFSKKQIIPIMVLPKKEDLQILVNLVKEGKLKSVIDSRHPLSKAEEAWSRSMEGHATGKIIIEV